VTWYLCTIGKAAPRNWELCKQVRLYGIPGSDRAPRPRVEAGDRVLVWQGGQGYIAEAAITGPARVPSGDDEAPWPGHTYRFAYVFPIEVVLEVESPLFLAFSGIGNKQIGTDFPKGWFQRGFASIPERAATYVSSLLREKRAADDLKAR
jgi:hypothetical protein